jgi:indolepyruvate ferredoxin oxidoreductase alpha subunit
VLNLIFAEREETEMDLMKAWWIEERMKKMEDYADEFKHNVMEINDTRFGIITSGVSYHYSREVFPEYSYLKLGMVWPLPKNLIGEFFKKVKKVYVVEELDPFLEDTPAM